jgi:uncharacterized protein
MNRDVKMKNTPSNERIMLLADRVESHLRTTAEKYPHPMHDPDYRMQHTLRVAHYGKQIAVEEGANIEQVIAACLLHDISHFESEEDYRSHGRLGAEISRPILQELGYSNQEVDHICYSIAVHVDGDAGYHHPETLEAKIVSDADNIDRFGSFRVIQWCTVDVDNYKALIDKLRNRIVKLKEYQQNNPLETNTGRKLFDKQLRLQIDFFNEIVAEGEITLTPTLS